jgi:CBS domain-containing membrane protein
MATFNLVNGGLSIGLIATVALLTQEAFIFPSLGATAFLLFCAPLSAPASPRNVFLGHATGAIVGWTCLAVMGLHEAPSALIAGVDWPRVTVAALSLGLTGCLMVLLRCVHPPAGATALIVSLGLMPHLEQIPILLGAVALLLVQAVAINRLAGIPYPLWSADPAGEPLHGARTPSGDA